MNYTIINQKPYAWFKRFASSSYSDLLLVLWSFFEASFWFILPDFILFIVIVLNCNKYKRLSAITLVSSSVGIFSYYIFVKIYSAAAFNSLINTPFVKSHMLETVVGLYQTGLEPLFLQSFSGIPSKVWTYTAVISHVPALPFFIIIFLSRAIRIMLVTFLGNKIGKKFKKKIQQNFIPILTIYIIIFFTIQFIIV